MTDASPNLIVVCAWCGKTTGMRPDPLGHGGITSTICDGCLDRHFPEEEPVR